MNASRKPDTTHIAEKVMGLTPPQRLRLAADLLEQGRGDIAHPIASTVLLELEAAIALRVVQTSKPLGG